jgi:putative acyl-CoA dehydrogenase
MRQAAVQAVHHARHRFAFGKLLAEHPLMQNVLADLIVESEAATLLMIRLAKTFDGRGASEQQRSFARIATAISKYWLCKRAPVQVGEALECLGGNGYVEESVMPRLYREAPLYGIWEGSGNVICLDVLRTLAKEPGSAEALIAEMELGADSDRRLQAFNSDVTSSLRRWAGGKGGADSEREARTLVERSALALQGSLLARYGSRGAADAFWSSRIAGRHGYAFGTLPNDADFQSILDGFGGKLAQ